MQNICLQCSNQFEITEQDLLFYEKISPVFKNKKYLIPPPTHCPDCRNQRRLAFCNERYLYPGKCSLCKNFTLTEYAPHRNQPIYCRECWHSEKWDAREYAQEIDLSRSFFEQIAELKIKTPAPALNIQGNCINSEYIHYAGSCKNCYLIMHADFCEDCYYGYGFKKNISCVDGFYNLHCELCYDCIDIHHCYGLKGSQDCISSHSSAFLRDCIGCSNCFCCVGLRNKKYCFENQQLSKEEYEKQMSKIDLGSYKTYQKYKQKRKELEKNHIFKEFQGQNTENCFGNHLYHCKNAQYSFDCENVEDAKFCSQVVLGAKDIYDIYQYGSNLRLSYECSISGENSYHLLFCDNCHMNSYDLIYCWYIERSKNCFGCASMFQASYCILNKQYEKEEYQELTGRIIEHMKNTGEWGEFFPMSMSAHGYNKSSAQMYYPLTKEQTEKEKLLWDEYEPPAPKIANIIPAKNLPDNINDISDDILRTAIECESSKRLFKITAQELKFYRQQKIPLPRRYPDERHLERFYQRNPRKFWKQNCENCQKKIQTTYDPEKNQKVYCEKCYLEKVY